MVSGVACSIQLWRALGSLGRSPDQRRTVRSLLAEAIHFSSGENAAARSEETMMNVPPPDG
jgi:hypothetical protein